MSGAVASRTMLPNQSTRVVSGPRALTGAEKVAVLLLALDKGKAARLLKHFDPDELRAVRHLATDLRPITAADLETLVEEFAKLFSTGVKFVGSAKEVERFFSDVLSENSAEAPPEDSGADDRPFWVRLS